MMIQVPALQKGHLSLGQESVVLIIVKVLCSEVIWAHAVRLMKITNDDLDSFTTRQ